MSASPISCFKAGDSSSVTFRTMTSGIWKIPEILAMRTTRALRRFDNDRVCTKEGREVVL